MSQPAPVQLVPGLFSLEGPEGPHLRGSRCTECGAISFPIRPVCPRCQTEAAEEMALSRTAKLYSYTVCSTAPAGWKAPYFQAYVELSEGLRVFTLISSEVEPRLDVLKVGMDMELVVEEARVGADGQSYLSYKFRPVQGGSEDA